MIYTNYDPTPTPYAPPYKFKFMQEPDESTLEKDVDDGFLHSYDVPDTMALATPVVGGKVFILPHRAGNRPTSRDFAGRRWCLTTYTATASVGEAHLDGWANVESIPASKTDGQDINGAGSIMTGAETSGSEAAARGFTCTLSTVQGRWGWYMWTRIMLPATMTSLANRVFLANVVSNGAHAEIYDADTGGTATTHYIALRWRQDTDATANWWVRCGNGSNDSNLLDTGVAVTAGTKYDVETWCDRTDFYVRINGGTAKKVSGSTTPSLSVAMNNTRQAFGRNTAAVTGNGAIAVKAYESVFIAP